MIQGNEGTSAQRRVFRGRGRSFQILFFGAFAAFFLGAALFGSQSPGLAGGVALFCCLFVCNALRQGLFVEAAGVRIVRPWRLRALRFEWDDIDRFELRTGAGQSPVNLICMSDQRAIAVPTFPKPRRSLDTPRYQSLRAKVQAQVDELNLLRKQHSAPRA
jgi:hypothetical protein